jgi:bifunctional non-homologous end joining protein LigD
VPIAWDELSAMKDAKPFAIGDAEELLAHAADKSLAGWGFAAQHLPDL